MNSITGFGVTITNPDVAGWGALAAVVAVLYLISLYSPQAEQVAIYIALALIIVVFLKGVNS